MFAFFGEAQALAQRPSVLPTLALADGAAPQSNVESSANVPAVARRLWDELLCTCGEADCKRPPLATCGCDYAHEERQRIVDEVQRLGFGSPERNDATYTALLRAYTEKHGADATLAAVHRNEWLDNLFTLGGFLAGLAAIIGIAERYRRRRGAPNARDQATPPRKRKSRRRKRL